MEKKSKVILGQLTEKDGKHGRFFSGQLGMTWITVAESKTPGKWNIYLEQKDRQERPAGFKTEGAGAVLVEDDVPF